MLKQIAEYYGLYLEKDLGGVGPKKWVLGDYQGKQEYVDVLAISVAEFRSLCEKMNPFA